MLGLLSIQKPPKVSGLDINATEPAVYENKKIDSKAN